MLNKKNVILDTDLGNDSDDIGAIAIMCNLYKEEKINIEAVTVSNSMIDPYLATDILLSYYGVNVPLGKCDTFLSEDPQHGTYARALRFIYKSKLEGTEPLSAVKVLRKALLKGNITLITIGPLTNISNLLNSEPDEISPLNGSELFNKSVKEMYIMGGSFTIDFAEWNIKEDISSAMNVINNTNCYKTFIPFEVGLKVKTGRNFLNDLNTPMGKGYYIHNIGARESWDPITVYNALVKENEASEMGKIRVLEDGRTVYTKDQNGKDKYILDTFDQEELTENLEELMVA